MENVFIKIIHFYKMLLILFFIHSNIRKRYFFAYIKGLFYKMQYTIKLLWNK